MPDIARESHYVPQATLRRWSEDGVHVWAYRLLVPHQNIPEWGEHRIRGMTKQRDLYTTFEGDQEGDDFEKFITREIEEPGQAAIEKLIGNFKMKPVEWHAVAKFVAAQQMQGLAVERALRWVITRKPAPWIVAIRPRTVDAESYAMEQESWKTWNDMHLGSEAEFNAPRTPHCQCVRRQPQRLTRSTADHCFDDGTSCRPSTTAPCIGGIVTPAAASCRHTSKFRSLLNVPAVFRCSVLHTWS